MRIFMSSGERSRTVSQNAVRRLFEGERQVSTMDHISLHNTSVATYGYLKIEGKFTEESRASNGSDVLESTLLLPFYLASYVPE